VTTTKPVGEDERSGTTDRILDAAVRSFGGRGFEATSLDDLAGELGVTKQTILYWFPSKAALLEAVIDRTAADLAGALERSLEQAGPGWDKIRALVDAVLRIGLRQPELLGLLREVSRLGPPATDRMTAVLDPLVQRARSFLEAEMAAGRMRPTDARLLLMSAYSTVLGMATEVDVLRAVGEEPTLASLRRRRRELLQFLRSALGMDDADPIQPEPPSPS
jgi:AcrR family transcriptional regulator